VYLYQSFRLEKFRSFHLDLRNMNLFVSVRVLSKFEILGSVFGERFSVFCHQRSDKKIQDRSRGSNKKPPRLLNKYIVKR